MKAIDEAIHVINTCFIAHRLTSNEFRSKEPMRHLIKYTTRGFKIESRFLLLLFFFYPGFRLGCHLNPPYQPPEAVDKAEVAKCVTQ